VAKAHCVADGVVDCRAAACSRRIVIVGAVQAGLSSLRVPTSTPRISPLRYARVRDRGLAARAARPDLTAPLKWGGGTAVPNLLTSSATIKARLRTVQLAAGVGGGRITGNAYA